MNEPNFLMESNVKPLPKSIISSHTVEITSLKSTGIHYLLKNIFLLENYKINKLSLGMIPCCRSSFIGILYNNDQIFIHGGTNEDVDLHDSYILDLETLVWSSYSIDCPYKLTLVGHAALLLNNENSNLKNLLIFGGWDGSKYIDTSYLLNLDSHCLKASYYKGWNTSNSLRFKGQLSSKSNLGNAKSWGGPKSCGSDIPSSRRDHTLTYDSSKNKIYLFGGISKKKKQ